MVNFSLAGASGKSHGVRWWVAVGPCVGGGGGPGNKKERVCIFNKV